MLNWKKLVLPLITIIFVLSATAQSTAIDTTEKSGVMASNGKIYVVMTVLITILGGLLLYVFRLDKKITRMEKEGV